MNEVTVRPAEDADVELIYSLIVALAEYEHAPEEVVGTPEECIDRLKEIESWGITCVRAACRNEGQQDRLSIVGRRQNNGLVRPNNLVARFFLARLATTI